MSNGNPDSFPNKVVRALNALATLQISTIVGDVRIELKKDDQGKSLCETHGCKIGDDNTAMTTTINMVQGDITTLINRGFLKQDMAPILEYHNEQVALGREILTGNVEALVSLAKTLGITDDELKGTPQTPSPDDV